MSLFLCVFLKVRRQKLIFIAIQISLFPTRLHQFHRSVSNMLSVHLFESIQEIIWICKRNKSIASCFASSSVSHYSCHLERTIASEDTRKNLIVDFIAQIAAKYSVVILRPILHCFIFPHFTCCFSQSLHLFLFLFLNSFILLWESIFSLSLFFFNFIILFLLL